MTEYDVYVDDNYHSMDESCRYKAGSYSSYGEALSRARAIVDEFLAEHHRPGMSSEELYEGYIGFGEDPFVVPAGDPRFSARDYARERCYELCREEDAAASVPRHLQWPAELNGFRAVLAASLARDSLGAAERAALGKFVDAVERYPNELPRAGRWYWLRLERRGEAFTVYVHPNRFQLTVLGVFPDRVDWEVRFEGSGRCDHRFGEADAAFEHMRDAAQDPNFTLKVSAR